MPNSNLQRFPAFTLQWMLFASAILVAGCRDDGRLARYPVTGVVTYRDGTPIENLVILFRSDQHGHRAGFVAHG